MSEPLPPGTLARGPLLPYEGPLPGADAVGESGSMTAGPGVRICLTLDEDACVAAAAFETVSFDDARPVASRLCGAVLGGTLVQASAVSIPDLALMAGLPERSPAVRTVHFAKSAALLPHLGRTSRDGPGITCTCFHVPTERIVDTIRRLRLTTVEEVRDATKAGSGCGTCRPELARILRETRT